MEEHWRGGLFGIIDDMTERLMENEGALGHRHLLSCVLPPLDHAGEGFQLHVILLFVMSLGELAVRYVLDILPSILPPQHAVITRYVSRPPLSMVHASHTEVQNPSVGAYTLT